MLLGVVSLLFPLVLFHSVSQGQDAGRIRSDQLTQGSSWTWLYSEWKSPSNHWEPYYFEKYSIIHRDQQFVTFEMSSAPYGDPNGLKSHHRFILDFKKCDLAWQIPSRRNFSVTLFNKTEKGDWNLVSEFHTGFIFREKFNCSRKMANEWISVEPFDEAEKAPKVFNINLRHRLGQGSWYFLDHPELEGVVARKNFPPELSYKFEFFKSERL